MVLINVTDSVRKTNYYNTLMRWEGMKDKNVTQESMSDKINIEIGVEDEFVILYFEIQDNFTNVMNNNDVYNVYDQYDLYNIMLTIHNFFNPLEDGKITFPFEIASFLIKHGYKENFLNDTYYLALLYETKEIYDRVMEDEYYRNNPDLQQKLIHLNKDILIIDPSNFYKYSDYIVSKHDFIFGDGLTVKGKMENEEVSKLKLNTYKEVVNILKNGNGHDIPGYVILNIIKIKGVAVCGDFVDRLINGNKNSVYNIDIYVYGDGKLADKVYSIIECIHKAYNNINIYQDDDAITILLLSPFRIIKKKYKSISNILIDFDTDSSACALYSINNKICVSYLPRYKFALEHRFNIINPYRRSSTYNEYLFNSCYVGYAIFIPGAIHKINNYFDVTKKFPQYTLQNLLYHIIIKKLNIYMENDPTPEYPVSVTKNIYNAFQNRGDDIVVDYTFANRLKRELPHLFTNVDIPAYMMSNEVLDIVENYLLEYINREGTKFNINSLEQRFNMSYKAFGFHTLRHLPHVLTITGALENWKDGTETHDVVNYSYLSIYDLSKREQFKLAQETN